MNNNRPVYRSLAVIPSERERWMGSAFLQTYLSSFSFRNAPFNAFQEMPNAALFLEDISTFMDSLRSALDSHHYSHELLSDMEEDAKWDLIDFCNLEQEGCGYESVDGVIKNLADKLVMLKDKWELNTILEVGSSLIAGLDDCVKNYERNPQSMIYLQQSSPPGESHPLDNPHFEFYVLLEGIRTLGEQTKNKVFYHPTLH